MYSGGGRGITDDGGAQGKKITGNSSLLLSGVCLYQLWVVVIVGGGFDCLVVDSFLADLCGPGTPNHQQTHYTRCPRSCGDDRRPFGWHVFFSLDRVA